MDHSYDNYDVFGRAGRTIDPNGVVTEFTYDTARRVATTTLKGVSGCDTTADPLCATDLITTQTYSPGAGSLASTTQPGGGITTYEYDPRGRTKAIVRLVATGVYERLETDYDPATGQKSAERSLSGQPGSWTVRRSQIFRYDSFGRLTETEHADGAKIVYGYDSADQLTSVQDELVGKVHPGGSDWVRWWRHQPLPVRAREPGEVLRSFRIESAHLLSPVSRPIRPLLHRGRACRTAPVVGIAQRKRERVHYVLNPTESANAAPAG